MKNQFSLVVNPLLPENQLAELETPRFTDADRRAVALFMRYIHG
jgi:hypothetical protein